MAQTFYGGKHAQERRRTSPINFCTGNNLAAVPGRSILHGQLISKTGTKIW